MTPAARAAAAIDVLDTIGQGAPAEQALTRWARANRYAGSKDRAAVRDHVFDVLRNWRADAVRGGGTSGRARLLGRLRAEGVDPATLFTGDRYAPAPLTGAERQAGAEPMDRADIWNLQDWMVPVFADNLGAEAGPTAQALCQRAPVTLRVNLAATTRDAAMAALAAAGIVTRANTRAETALTVIRGARRIRACAAFLQGHVELQDAASQAALDTLGDPGRALDYCAGGGGKALALAARGWQVTAHDAEVQRMRDLPARAARGGHDIAICPPERIGGAGRFDLVLCDAPCSGAGTWRRTPDAKWRLTPERLAQLHEMQAGILDRARAHVAPGGVLAYATCSVLASENDDQVAAFLDRHPGWTAGSVHRWPVDPDGDGFFIACLTRG